MSITDSHGVMRIPHKDRKVLNPCKCIRSANGLCCHKNYCPCRKAGFYCGSACNCFRSQCNCTNSLITVLKEGPPPAKKPKVEERPLSPGLSTSTDELLTSLEFTHRELSEFTSEAIPDPLGGAPW